MWSHRTPPRLSSASYRSKRSYFITFCVLGREPAFADPTLAELASSVIRRYRTAGYYYLPAYCVMPDHIHLLIVPQSSGRHVSRIVATLKNEILRAVRSVGHILRWQWGYY